MGVAQSQAVTRWSEGRAGTPARKSPSDRDRGSPPVQTLPPTRTAPCRTTRRGLLQWHHAKPPPATFFGCEATIVGEARVVPRFKLELCVCSAPRIEASGRKYLVEGGEGTFAVGIANRGAKLCMELVEMLSTFFHRAVAPCLAVGGPRRRRRIRSGLGESIFISHVWSPTAKAWQLIRLPFGVRSTAARDRPGSRRATRGLGDSA